MDGDTEEIQKEMGDVMEHLVFYAMIGKEQGLFDMGDVLTKEADKLVFRHPHIYGYTNERGEHVKPECKTPDEVSKLWERVKQIERQKKDTPEKKQGVLSGVPRSLPSLIKAYRIQDKASNVGFDWEKPEDVWQKVYEEIDELKAELEKGNKENSERELGDVIFALVNAARLYHINPDTALELTNRKFTSRFEYVEQKAREQGRDIKDLTLGEMDRYWEEAKKLETED